MRRVKAQEGMHAQNKWSCLRGVAQGRIICCMSRLFSYLFAANVGRQNQATTAATPAQESSLR